MTYIASPFFNSYEIAVRDRMLDKVVSEFGDDFFRPDSTDSSRSYDGHPSERLAKQIYKENIEHISNCDILVFPRFTTDLGTMMEVGFAIYLGKTVISYNYLDNSFTDITDQLKNFLKDIPVVENEIVDCRTVSGGIVFGYLVNKVSHIGYCIGNDRDNIMLHVAGTRYNEEYTVVTGVSVNDIA